MLRGIFPITLTPFDEQGQIDAASLRRVVAFELDGGVDGIGVGGFASEAYKLTDAERLHIAETVADEVGGRVPLIVGIAPNSTESALQQVKTYAALEPAALMMLPPNTMKLDEDIIVEHYVRVSEVSSVPIMLQYSPQIQAYAGVALSVDALVQIAERAPNVSYFKIEGPGSAEKIAAVHERVGERITMFGGVGGLGLREEFQAGAAGLLPGCGFNEFFVQAWASWVIGDAAQTDDILKHGQPLVTAVSGRGHEFSLHARKILLQRAGIIAHTTVRQPTVNADPALLDEVLKIADEYEIRIAQK